MNNDLMRGMMIGVPISLALWVIIILAVITLVSD